MTETQMLDALYGVQYKLGWREPHGGALALLAAWAERLRGLSGRGVPAMRDRFVAACALYAAHRQAAAARRPDLKARCERDAAYHTLQRDRIGLGLARMAGQFYDEHGSGRGDYLTTEVYDAVPAAQSAAAPYHDTGRAGMALVGVARKRVYARSSKWYPSTATSIYLCGRNEAGTFFAHPVPTRYGTVASALDWIWSGYSRRILQRQGDIALVFARGPKLPPTGLPRGHRVDQAAGVIRHATHPDLPLPGPGQRIIVARRAAVRVSAATRD